MKNPVLSPDDPALADYWVARRRRGRRPLDRARLRLLQAQRGRCPRCGDLVLHAEHEPRNPDEWEQWSHSHPQGDAPPGDRQTGPGTPTNAPQSDSPTPTAEVASQTAPGGAPATPLPA